jgi:hypothetical protein
MRDHKDIKESLCSSKKGILRHNHYNTIAVCTEFKERNQLRVEQYKTDSAIKGVESS